MSYADLPCQKAVTVLTDYAEGALAAEDRAVLERHLSWCEWCATYYDQLRRTVDVAESLRDEDENERAPSPTVVEDLLAAFRNSRRR